MTYASAQPLKPSEQPPERTLGEAVDALKAGVTRQARAFYNRPIAAGAKAVMHRILGEKPD
jgi:hypothetical protein